MLWILRLILQWLKLKPIGIMGLKTIKKNQTSFLVISLFTILFISCKKEDRQPNIIFFLVDDLGWTDVGCYGSSFYETPNIDALAAEGVRFTSAYAACHVCSPTRASILTGRYPASINLTDWLPGRRDFPFQKLLNPKINQHLPYDIQTLPKVLKENDYQTAILGKWHLGEDSASTAQQGFDLHLPDWNRGWPKNGYYFPYGMKGLEDGNEGEYLTDRMTSEALKYMEENRDKPFFLYLSHFAVHDPIEGRPDLVEKYQKKLANIPLPESPPFILEGKPGVENPISRTDLDKAIEQSEYGGFKVFPNQTVKIKQHQDNVQFAGMVESVDESLGRVLDKLDELGIDDQTIVIFYSDNGGMSAANFWDPKRVIYKEELDKAYSTSNLPLRGAKGWMYEGGIRVPLIIKWPGKKLQKAICDVPVTSPDFFPTILDMVGIRNTENYDGLSLVPLLNGDTILNRKAIFWHFPHYSNHGMQSAGGAVRSGDFKLIEYYETGKVQLFNLKDDIGEQTDLSEIEVEKTTELKERLHKWRKEIGAQMMQPNPNYDPFIKSD
ncbi:MAG: sulfatase [Flavobacteriaceae bacterium]|nr:MAG: sulfatase [Flavobacteriaceae bacterium]